MGMGAELMKKIFESCKKINKKHRVLASVVLASVIIVGCISVKPTLAYFTKNLRIGKRLFRLRIPVKLIVLSDVK